MKCSYGCGNEGIFKLKNGKYSCCKSANSCPAKKVAIADKSVRENPGLCDFGCGNSARFYFGQSKKWCCEKYRSSCPSESIRIGKLRKEKHIKYSEESKRRISIALTGKHPISRWIPIENSIEKCSYGCGNPARFYLKRLDKYCCSKSHHRCQSMRKIKSQIVKDKCKDTNFRKKLSLAQKGKKCNLGISLEVIDLSKLCDYGCGLVAKYYLPTVKKYCCSDRYTKCKICKDNISTKQKENWKDPNSKHRSLERKMKRSEYVKQQWINGVYSTDKYLYNLGKSLSIKPNNPEKIISKILPESFRYCGDFSFWIERKNPDFINENDKKIVELFGDYWHGEKRRKDGKTDKIHENDLKNHYLKNGYKCLVIWEHELSNLIKVAKKIKKFCLE